MEVSMFRLMKLAIYALAGFALYELYQGMTQGSAAGDCSRSRGRGNRNLGRALNSDGGRMQTLTGPGLGRTEQTLDPDGGSVPHQVGRGVVS
jgi:hypothetical protein